MIIVSRDGRARHRVNLTVVANELLVHYHIVLLLIMMID